MPPRQRAQVVKRTLPTPTPEADAAVNEVIDPKKMISVDFNDHIYTFKRKRAESVQFRLRLQKLHDVEAMEWLLGPEQFDEFMEHTADEDGCTTAETYAEFIDALFQELGAGNSSRSSR